MAETITFTPSQNSVAKQAQFVTGTRADMALSASVSGGAETQSLQQNQFLGTESAVLLDGTTASPLSAIGVGGTTFPETRSAGLCVTFSNLP